MKISAIMNLIKKSKTILLYKKDNKQWIGDGAAAYAIHCLPQLDEDQVCTIAGIPDDKIGRYSINDNAEWLPVLDVNDSNTVLTLEHRNAVMYTHKGKTLSVFIDMLGNMYMIDTKYLKPLADYTEEDSLSYFVWDEGSDIPMILVRAGFILVAVIAPVEVSEELQAELSFITGKLQAMAQTERSNHAQD